MTSRASHSDLTIIDQDTSNEVLLQLRPMSENEKKNEEGALRESELSKKEPTSMLEQDKAYGWVIVFAAFMTCWIIGVIFIAFSILYMDFVAHFEAPLGVTGWIGSLYLATGNILGDHQFKTTIFNN